MPDDEKKANIKARTLADGFTDTAEGQDDAAERAYHESALPQRRERALFELNGRIQARVRGAVYVARRPGLPNPS